MSESTDALPAEPDPAAIGFAVLASGMEEAIAAVQAEIATLSRVLQASASVPHAVPPPPPAMAAKPEQPPEAWARVPDGAPPARQSAAERKDAIVPPPAVAPAPTETRSLPMMAPGVPETAGATEDRAEVYAPPPPPAQTTNLLHDDDVSARLPPSASPPAVLAPGQVPPDRVTGELGLAPPAPIANGIAELAATPVSAAGNEVPWTASEPVSLSSPAALPINEPAREFTAPAQPPTARPVGLGVASPWPASVAVPTWAPPALTQIAPLAPAYAPRALTQMAPAAPDMLPMDSPAPNSAPGATHTRTTSHQHRHTSDRSTPLHGDVFLDGMRVGHWLAETLAREAGGPAGGGTSFDPRLGPRWPGALQGQ